MVKHAHHKPYTYTHKHTHKQTNTNKQTNQHTSKYSSSVGNSIHMSAKKRDTGCVGCTGPIMQATPPGLITLYASQMPRCGSGPIVCEKLLSVRGQKPSLFQTTTRNVACIAIYNRGCHCWQGVLFSPHHHHLPSPHTVFNRPCRHVSIKRISGKWEVLCIPLQNGHTLQVFLVASLVQLMW